MLLLIKILLSWSAIFVSLKFADYLANGVISSYLSNHNVTIRFGFLSVHTTRFNSNIESATRRHGRLLKPWFSLGVLSGFFGMILSLIVLSHTLIRAFTFSISNEYQQQTIQPALLHPRPRLPLWHAQQQPPWWLPSVPWKLLLARDHQPAGFYRMKQTKRSTTKSSTFTSDEQPTFKQQEEESNDRDIRPLMRAPKAPNSLPQQRLHSIENGYLHKPPSIHSRHILSEPHLNTNSFSTTKKNNSPSQSTPFSSSFLTPLIPGVTVPEGDIIYMILSILISAAFHEAGHALAAGMHRARTDGVGAFIALMIPGAYVRLRGVELLSPFSQLQVWCAGAWHNTVLTLFALIAVAILPSFSSICYVLGSGALVVSVERGSPLESHLSPGDILLHLGPVAVTDGGPSFRDAVHELVKSRHSAAFCVPRAMLRKSAVSPTAECCVRPGASTKGVECFQQVTQNSPVVRKFCLDPELVSSRPLCRSNRDCRRLVEKENEEDGSLERDERMPVSAAFVITRKQKDRLRQECLTPVLPVGRQLIDVRLRSGKTRKTVHLFYEGYAEVLGSSVTVSSYVPRGWEYLPLKVLKVLAVMDLPNMMERLLQYLASISLALAVVNMAPVLFLDGQASATLFMKVLLKSPVRATKVGKVLMRVGSLLLLANIVLVGRDVIRR